MISVEQLWREDVSGKIISVSGGTELRGQCPNCGGTDRFGVFPEQKKGKGSYFCGRFKGSANTGCAKGGDIIQYLRDFRGMSFADACGFLGIETKNTNQQSYLRYSSPRPSHKTSQAKAAFIPVDKMYPPEVVDPAKWREHGMKFVNECHAALMKRPTSIAYLMHRGISLEVIKEYKLGYHAGQTTRGKDGQPTYRPWPSWGLKDEKKTGGRSRLIALPAGIVIPYIVSDNLHRITIRRNVPDSNGIVYHYVKGSMRDLWFTNPEAKVFVTIEAELDCLAVISVAGDIVGTIGIGTTGAKPDKRIHAIANKSQCILGCLDFDKPRKNPKTGRTEMPGGYGSVWWSKTYPQHKRWPVPVGKDPGEAFQAGVVNLRAWLILGMPSHLRPKEKTTEQPPVSTEQQPKYSEQPEINSCVIEMDLSNGETIYLIKFDEFGRLTEEGRLEWQRLTSEKKPVFTEKEMGFLQQSISEMEPEEKLAAGLLAVDVKKIFGGVIKTSRKITAPEQVEELIERETAKGDE